MIKKRSILAGVTAIAVILSTGAVAFAATDTTETQTDNGKPAFMEGRSAVMADLTDAQREAVQQVRADIMKEALNDLVDKGTITQDQVDQMNQAKTAEVQTKLTDAQREAVTESVTAAAKEALTNLVEKGVLTQEEADAISVVPRIGPDEKGAFNVLSEDQFKALNEAMKAKWESALSGLVDDGTLTQDQADQLLNDKAGMGSGGGPGFGGHRDFNGKPGDRDQADSDQDTDL